MFMSPAKCGGFMSVLIMSTTLAPEALAGGATSAEKLGSLPVTLEAGETRAQTYALNQLGLVEGRITRLSFLGIPIVQSETWWPVVGKYRYDISRSEFLERVGQSELAADQSVNDLISNLLFFGGVVVSLSGIAAPLLMQDDSGVTTTGLIVGGSLFLGGVVLTNVGSAMSGPVVAQGHAAQLARNYNAALRTRIESAGLEMRRRADATTPRGIALTLRF